MLKRSVSVLFLTNCLACVGPVSAPTSTDAGVEGGEFVKGRDYFCAWEREPDGWHGQPESCDDGCGDRKCVDGVSSVYDSDGRHKGVETRECCGPRECSDDSDCEEGSVCGEDGTCELEPVECCACLQAADCLGVLATGWAGIHDCAAFFDELERPEGYESILPEGQCRSACDRCWAD